MRNARRLTACYFLWYVARIIRYELVPLYRRHEKIYPHGTVPATLNPTR